MKWKLQMEPDKVIDMVISSVTRARNYTDDVEWSAEDATRTEHDFLCRCVESAIKAGATTINIPDTVGYTVPEEYFALIAMLRERVANTSRPVPVASKPVPVPTSAAFTSNQRSKQRRCCGATTWWSVSRTAETAPSKHVSLGLRRIPASQDAVPIPMSTDAATSVRLLRRTDGRTRRAASSPLSAARPVVFIVSKNGQPMNPAFRISIRG